MDSEPQGQDQRGRISPLRERVASIRGRSTLVAVLVVGAALTVGALGLLSLLGSSLHEGVESAAQAQVNDVTSLLRLGQLPAQLPAGRGDMFTQIVGPDGRVVASSATLVATEPISTLRPSEEGGLIKEIPVLSSASTGAHDTEGPYLLLARTVNARTRTGSELPVTVFVAGSLRPMVEATTTLGTALTVGLPVLVGLVGLLVWTFTGRVLRPVEAIRAEVADISGRGLHRRVPIPATYDEVGRLARTMNEMLDRLESSAAVQRRFIADASHELRSPLAAIQATLEVALADPDDFAWEASATDALDEARRLHRLVEDLLLLARSDETTVGLARSELVDLDEIVLRESRLFWGSGEVSLDLRQVSGGRVLGDHHQLTRVVHNLMDNARRHATSTVKVELSSTDDEVTFVVADDGPGIDPSDRGRVFDRFARLDEARSQDAGGSGLGLAIVREIVMAHGGTVGVADSSAGARFELRLPGYGPDLAQQ